MHSKDLDRGLICPGGRRSGGRVRLGVSRLFGTGKVRKRRGEWARVERLSERRLKLTVALADLGLGPGRLEWSVRSGWSGERCAPQQDSKKQGRRKRVEYRCHDRLPDRGRFRYRIAPLVRVGCTPPSSADVIRGPSRRRRVALTFDDGPGPYTRRIVSVLDRFGAKGTFFAVGSKVPGGASVLRRALRNGHELANHSFGHEPLPSSSSMRRTNQLIKATTGFRPCLFRPPYGLISGATILSARANGMSSIRWDIDTNDWQRPGSGAIASRALAAGNGSIVLMHDAGGDRAQTLDALPRIIKKLRDRGQRLVTVTRLLGGRFKIREKR